MEEKNEKSLELERKIRYRDNLNREIEMFKMQLPDVHRRLEIHRATVELLIKNQKIAIDNFTFEDPKWGYERVPEYIENIRQLNILNFEKAQIDWKNQEGQLLNTIDSINAQVGTATKELDKVTNEIEELTKGE